MGGDAYVMMGVNLVTLLSDSFFFQRIREQDHQLKVRTRE